MKTKDKIDFLLDYVSKRSAAFNQSVNKTSQILLYLKYKEMLDNNSKLPRFEDVGFSNFSQNDEDGILLYIFSLIGTTNKKAVEICAGNGIICNTANLIINHGWNGLLFDGKKENIEEGKTFYSWHKDTWIYPPHLINAWIDKDNVNYLIEQNGFGGDIDLLSLDMDGVDYWIWKEINCINPRVVVLEFNNILGSEKSISIPYNKHFNRYDYNECVSIKRFGSDYWGASLKAFIKLGKEKGYRFVGCNKYEFNAFFIRGDIGKNIFPEISIEECFKTEFAKERYKKGFSNVIHYDWVNI